MSGPSPVNVRPAAMADARDIHALRVMTGVFENILSLQSERLEDVEDFLRGMRDPLLAAEVDGRVVGLAGLEVSKPARQRHVGTLGIMVHREYQGRGIGRSLLSALLDIADRWLMLKRVQLTVFTDNQRAIGLYKSLGFVVEGTERFVAIRDGRYADEYLMARYRE